MENLLFQRGEPDAIGNALEPKRIEASGVHAVNPPQSQTVTLALPGAPTQSRGSGVWAAIAGAILASANCPDNPNDISVRGCYNSRALHSPPGPGEHVYLGAPERISSSYVVRRSDHCLGRATPPGDTATASITLRF